jgi:hypothetical protein
MKSVEHVSIKRGGPLAWPVALVLIVLMGLAPGIARAEDDQSSDDLNSIWNLDKKAMYELLRSFSLTPKRTLEDQFGYHERAPLVVPSSRALPAPQTAPARDPNWPVEKRASQEAAKKRTTYRRDGDPGEFADPLPPSALRSAPGGGAEASVPNHPASNVETTDNLRPSQLGSPPGGFFGSLFSGGNNAQQQQQQQQPSQQQVLVSEPPPRTRLVDPPPGYLTPSSSQPYGTGQPAGYGRQSTTRHDDPLNE